MSFNVLPRNSYCILHWGIGCYLLIPAVGPTESEGDRRLYPQNNQNRPSCGCSQLMKETGPRQRVLGLMHREPPRAERSARGDGVARDDFQWGGLGQIPAAAVVGLTPWYSSLVAFPLGVGNNSLPIDLTCLSSSKAARWGNPALPTLLCCAQRPSLGTFQCHDCWSWGL